MPTYFKFMEIVLIPSNLPYSSLKLGFQSLDEVVGDLRIRVRPYVRLSFTRLLENRPLLFSETLQLVRACKREKNIPSPFLKNSSFAHFGQNCLKLAFLPKMPKNGGFSHFFAICSLEFCNFFLSKDSRSPQNSNKTSFRSIGQRFLELFIF